MGARIKGFYSDRPTLAELTEDAGAELLVWGGYLPSGVQGSALTQLIHRECDDLDTLAFTVEEFSAQFSAWLVEHTAGWQKEYAALVQNYAPLNNYDRTDTESESVTTTGTANSTATSTDSGSDVTTHDRQGFNSAEFVGTDRDTMQHGRANTTSGSNTSGGTETRQRTLTSSGNIGVTTSQQMLESELKLRRDWNIYRMICDDFRRALCVGVW